MMHRASLVILLLLATQGCRCSEEPAPADQSPTVPSSAAPDDRCALVAGNRFSLQGQSGQVEPEEAELPFGVEVGRVAFAQQQHWVPFIRGGRSGASAGLLVLGEAMDARIIELGPLHGDVPPPKVVTRDSRVVVVLAETDASGGAYRLGSVAGGVGGDVDWFAEADQHGDDSPAFDALLLPAGGMLVWDDWNEEAGHSEIRLSRFDERQATRQLGFRRVSPEATDAESPRLLTRGSGAWLVWIALGKPDELTNPAMRASTDEPSADDDALLVNRSWLEVVRLDEAGQPEGEPLRVTPTRGSVVAYDAIAAHGDHLLLAAREDASIAELDEGTIRVLRLSGDGSVQEEAVQAPNLGASAPSLIFDSKPGGGAPHGWMVLASRSGQTMIGGLTPFGSPLEIVQPDPGLGRVGVLAARGGQLLVTKPSGQGAVFETMHCDVAEMPPADAGVLPSPTGQ